LWRGLTGKIPRGARSLDDHDFPLLYSLRYHRGCDKHHLRSSRLTSKSQLYCSRRFLGNHDLTYNSGYNVARMELLARRLLGNVPNPPLCGWYLPSTSHPLMSSVIHNLKFSHHLPLPRPHASPCGWCLQYSCPNREFRRTRNHVDYRGKCDGCGTSQGRCTDDEFVEWVSG
jgi:hypothetical protein